MRAYKNYGGRGIAVCQAWLNSFECFLRDMGPRPSPKHSIDRIDNDGNYEPGNCRWATGIEQAANTRKCIILEFRGERRTASDWANHLGLPRRTVIQRVKVGWPVEMVLSHERFKGQRGIGQR